MGVKGVVKGDSRGGTSSLTTTQEVTANQLRAELTSLAKRVKTSKLKLADKVKLLGTLVKSHEALTKAERSVAGLDKDTGIAVTVGVIVVPQKAKPGEWADHAQQEIAAAARTMDSEDSGTREGSS